MIIYTIIYNKYFVKQIHPKIKNIVLFFIKKIKNDRDCFPSKSFNSSILKNLF